MQRWEAITLGCTTAFVGVTAWALRSSPVLPAALVFTAASCVLSLIDVRERRLPRRIVFPALGLVAAIEVVAALVAGEPARIAWAALGAVAAFCALLAIHLISPSGMGFGDVTYAPLIGATLGWFGLGRVGLGLMLGFLAGAILAGPLAIAQRSTRATFPFGPALAIGAWLALCFGPAITNWYA